MTLNEAQQRAVDHEGNLLVVAGPGSGKTRTATHRCAKLIREGAEPWRILLVTFTNKAAGEMKDRMSQLVSSHAVKELWAGTFHSICAKLLRKLPSHMRGDRQADFIIYDKDDGRRMIRRLLAEAGFDKHKYEPDEVLKYIDAHKCYARKPEDVLPQDPREADMNRIWGDYERNLIVANAFDFSDLLLYGMEAAEAGNDAGRELRSRFDYVVVDEYQDTNAVQHRFIKALVVPAGNMVFAVGDPRQAIYGFRGAHYSNILQFPQEFDAELIILDRCYRSTRCIVELCNIMIADNALVKAGLEVNPEMQTPNESGERVWLRRCTDSTDEARYVWRQIQLRLDQGCDPGQLAVLYRLRALSRPVEEQLLRRGIRYEIVGGRPFYERREIKDAIAYIRLVYDTESLMDFERAIAIPSRKIGPKALQKISKLVSKHGRVWPAIEAALTEPKVLNTLQRKNLQQFVDVITQSRARLGYLSLAKNMNMLFEATGLRKALTDFANTKHGQEREREMDRVHNIDSLVEAIAAYEDRASEPSLGGWLEEAALMSEQDELKDDYGRVKLLTIHAAKGLEFAHVWVVGVEEQILPYQKAIEEGKVDEEERLAYVAASRAMDSLSISWCQHRLLYGKVVRTGPSPFIRRIWDRAAEKNLIESEELEVSRRDLSTSLSAY